MGTIKMTLRAIDWTMGEVGSVFVGLKDGNCRIDWGDGHTSSIKAHTRGIFPQHEAHVYASTCKKSGDTFQVTISSSENNIVFFNTGSIDMEILEVDISECPELERLEVTGRPPIIDTRFNGHLKDLKIEDAHGIDLDLSQNHALEYLTLYGYDNPRLDISKCDSLWYLHMGISHVKEIAVSNRSSLKELIFWNNECPLTARSLKFINSTLERNNGTITLGTI